MHSPASLHHRTPAMPGKKSTGRVPPDYTQRGLVCFGRCCLTVRAAHNLHRGIHLAGGGYSLKWTFQQLDVVYPDSSLAGDVDVQLDDIGVFALTEPERCALHGPVGRSRKS